MGKNGKARQPTPPVFRTNNEPWDQAIITMYAKRAGVPSNQICCICLDVIVMQIYKNTGVCCENHRKDRDNDHAPSRGISSGPKYT